MIEIQLIPTLAGLNLFSQANLTDYRPMFIRSHTKAKRIGPATKECHTVESSLLQLSPSLAPGQQAYSTTPLTDWLRVLYLAPSHVLYSICDLTSNDNPAAGWKLPGCGPHETVLPLSTLSAIEMALGEQFKAQPRPQKAGVARGGPMIGSKSLISAPIRA